MGKMELVELTKPEVADTPGVGIDNVGSRICSCDV